ncbi:MAG TPA: universal stress protein [Streptosporangiaceae bacterium]|nr:universal stress protein [Streptosporangiaceae bacterium]
MAGVDGSAPSRAALAWAIGQARLTGAVVDAVIAWSYPADYGFPMPAQPESGYRGVAGRVLASAIADVSAATADPPVIRPSVTEGHPARVLLDASAGAELLVVGNRGHGGLAGALLGSVSQHCVRHAAPRAPSW